VAKKLYIIIVGCGKLGSYLANNLSSSGHAVVVIDRDTHAFNALSSEYSGFQIEGDATELAVLTQAKMNQADMVVSVTPDENINMMVTQVAKNTFNVSRVLARTYDAKRERMYSKLGIETICTTSVIADLFLQHIIQGKER
jgi:trk system potassium uptake protein TrkA